jgi:hypothetical protein
MISRTAATDSSLVTSSLRTSLLLMCTERKMSYDGFESVNGLGEFNASSAVWKGSITSERLVWMERSHMARITAVEGENGLESYRRFNSVGQFD